MHVSQAFEWVVHDVGKLRDFVEGRNPEDAVDGRGASGHDAFGVLRESPTLGDGKYKLEIGMKQAGPFPFVDLKGHFQPRRRLTQKRPQLPLRCPST
jgi:hypothetical protein